MQLILASSSFFRKQLLAAIGITPDHIISPDVDETPLKNEAIRAYVHRIAILKARAVHAQMPEAYILAADTAVEMGGKIFLKAPDKEAARATLKRFSGRRHRIYTAVCVISPQGKEVCRVVLTRLSIKRLTTDELEDYLSSGEWEGKAGAYSVQGKYAKFVKFMSGSYSNVVGLPLYETNALLQGLGFRT